MSSEGFVSIIDKDGNEIRKTIARNQNNIVISGQDMFTPEISELVKRFAIGGSDNEILSAIRSGKNLKSLISVDTNLIEKLKYEIRVKESELVKFSDELKIALNAPHEKLSAEKKKSTLMEEIKELEQKHTILQKQHDSIALSNVENSGIINEKLKAKSSELQQIESKINDSNRNIEFKKQKINKYFGKYNQYIKIWIALEMLTLMKLRESIRIWEISNIKYKNLHLRCLPWI
jgi:hypothetical protein